MNIKDSRERTTFNTGAQLLAAAWNLLWAIEMRCKKPECVDTPWRDNAEG